MYPWGCGAWCGCWVSHTISCGILRPCLLVIMMVAGGGVVLCENCIVDAKSFFCLISCFLCCFVCVFRVAHHQIGWCVCCKGARWMPGHVKPMKDVKGCVKPRGVAD